MNENYNFFYGNDTNGVMTSLTIFLADMSEASYFFPAQWSDFHDFVKQINQTDVLTNEKRENNLPERFKDIVNDIHMEGDNLFLLYSLYQTFLLLAQFEPEDILAKYKTPIRKALKESIKHYKLEKLVSPDACVNCFYDACTLVAQEIRKYVLNFLKEVNKRYLCKKSDIVAIGEFFDIDGKHYKIIKGKSAQKISHAGMKFVLRDGILTKKFINFLKRNDFTNLVATLLEQS